MVEHVSRGEKEDSNDGESSPEVAVLHNRHHVRPGHEGTGETAENDRCDDDDSNPVYWPTDGDFGRRRGELLG